MSNRSIRNAGRSATAGRRREPGGGEQPGAEAEGDGQPGRQQGQLGFGVGQRRATLGEPGSVIGEQSQHPPGRGPVGAGRRVNATNAACAGGLGSHRTGGRRGTADSVPTRAREVRRGDPVGGRGDGTRAGQRPPAAGAPPGRGRAGSPAALAVGSGMTGARDMPGA